MIPSIMRTAFWNLRRDRAALLLTFVLPIAFFSIFAVIFGKQGSQKTPTIQIAVADEDKSEGSRRLIEGLKGEPAFRLQTEPKVENGEVVKPFDRTMAEAAVRRGDVPVALVIPAGFGASQFSFGPTENRPKLQLLNDSSNPLAAQIVTGMLQKVAMTSMPDMLANAGVKYLDKAAGGLTPEQHEQLEKQMQVLQELSAKRRQENASSEKEKTDGGEIGLISVETKDVLGEKKTNPLIAFYAAGIGVMFLLFTASGAGGVLLDEAESGALDRVLATRVSLPTLLLGKLAYLTLLGSTQLTVMFAWGALVFKLDLLSHIPGFVVMTIVTAMAASAFGLLLASASRTRAQLGAMSTLIILIMSSLGGSMFPRFIMPESVQKIGLITFNAWALDGYIKVFWRDEPIVNLWPQVLVLFGATVVFFAVARRLAQRWEYL
jgi:ABC-2 type transport system permease protein